MSENFQHARRYWICITVGVIVEARNLDIRAEASVALLSSNVKVAIKPETAMLQNFKISFFLFSNLVKAVDETFFCARNVGIFEF